MDALHEEAEDVNISREGETPIPATVDIENTMQVIEAQEACNQLMALREEITRVKLMMAIIVFLITNIERTITTRRNKGTKLSPPYVSMVIRGVQLKSLELQMSLCQ